MLKIKRKNNHCNEGEKNRFSKENKHLIRRIVLLVFAAFLLLSMIALIRFMWVYFKTPLEQQYLVAANEELPVYSYIYEPDFEENIFEDETYLKRNRDMMFTSGAQTVRVALDDTEHTFSEDIVFFQKYFLSIVNGDYETYLTFFDDEYDVAENNLRLPTKPFTMQKIYDITVELKSTSYHESGIQEAFYVVSYKFQDNNGSFRNDLRDGEIRPLTFKVRFYNDGLLITQIQPYVSIVVS